MHPTDLEGRVGRELRQLPFPDAPQSLLPRVMAAVHAWSRRPWYERAWFTWPVWGQVTSAAAVLVLLVAGGVGLPAVWASVTEGLSVPQAAGIADRAGFLAGQVELGMTALWILWRTAMTPFLYYASAPVALMGVACALVALALNRFAIQGMLES